MIKTIKKMKDEKDIMLEHFFKEVAEVQISDHGFTEQVINALPEGRRVENKAIRKLRKWATTWNIIFIIATIALFILMKGWNIAYDLLATLIATAHTFDYTYLLFWLMILPLAVVVGTVYLFRTSYRLF